MVGPAYTSGPWATHRDFPDLVIPEIHQGRLVGCAEDAAKDRDEYAQVITRVGQDRHGRGDAKANARLIAAAPDLAWFTKQIFNGIDTGMLHIDTPADETLANVLRRGRAAIAKAEGRS